MFDFIEFFCSVGKFISGIPYYMFNKQTGDKITLTTNRENELRKQSAQITKETNDFQNFF